MLCVCVLMWVGTCRTLTRIASVSYQLFMVTPCKCETCCVTAEGSDSAIPALLQLAYVKPHRAAVMRPFWSIVSVCDVIVARFSVNDIYRPMLTRYCP